MKIDKIKVENFKNFSEVTVDFEDGVNLFVGSNGSGKTSILEAINIAVGAFFGSQEQKLQRMILFDEIKITNGKREDKTKVYAESNKLDIKWERTIKSNTKNNDTKNIKNISNYGRKLFDKFNDEDDRTIAPLIVYYSTQRLFKDAYLSNKQRYDAANGRRNGYLQCLKENAIKSVLNEWLGNAVTRRATLQIKQINKIDNILFNVEDVIKKTLIDFLGLPKDFSLKIYQDPDYNNELFVNYDLEHDLPISYYSDGFRNILYLVIDLVWRASQLNPWLSFDEIPEKVFGVVTIDEIDLHLHPKWQAKVIPLIKEIFPRVQFFMTTHSPTVVANFESGTLYIIENNAIVKHQSDYFGKQVNSVLRNILGASDRHVPTQEKLNCLFKLIDENKPEEYMPMFDGLVELLGPEDIDINKAKALIEWNNYLKDAVHKEE